MSTKPKYGDERNFGTQTQVYTDRGWVICDNQDEIDEELDKLREKGLL